MGGRKLGAMNLKPNNPTIAGGVLAIILIGALTFTDSPDSSLLQRTVISNGSGLPRGTAAPDFQLASVQGKRMSLNDLKGKSAVLVFVTRTCQYCTDLKENLLDQDLPDLNNRLVFVNSSKNKLHDLSPEIQEFETQLANLYPVLLDSTQSVYLAYNVRGVPTTYLIDEEGKIVASEVGPGGLGIVRRLIEEILETRGT